MKTFQRKSQIIIIISLFIILMVGQEAFAQGGFISGKVTKSDGKTAIVGVNVMASSKTQEGEKRHIRTVKTSTNGEYVIENLPSGTYRVWAHLDGYIDSYKSNISVASNKVTENINFILIKEAIIYGKVTEADGVTPISGVTVSIDDPDKIPKAATETDVEGKYQIRWIPPDKYWIRVKKDGYAMLVTLPENISEGQKIIGLNFQLEESATISGKVMIENTTVPVENAAIFIGSEKRLYDYIVTDVDGNYLLKGLPSGPCDIVIRAIDYKSLSSKINIASGEDIVNKNFYLQPIE